MCCPVSRFMGERAVQARGAHVWDVTALQVAVCANNCWQSSKRLPPGVNAHEKGCHSRVEKGSVWDTVLKESMSSVRLPKRLRRKTSFADAHVD